MEDPSEDERIILKWILKTLDKDAWIRLIWQ
jgi:hypothetical protein